METIDDVLAHFGIKGMRWGVRRPRGSDGHVEGESHPHATDAEKATEYHTRAKSSGTHTLSNQELQHLVNRMNLEQQYGRLTTPQKSALAKGGKFVGEVLVQVGKQQVARLASDLVTKQVAGALKK